jgi:hypothetical protein
VLTLAVWLLTEQGSVSLATARLTGIVALPPRPWSVVGPLTQIP